MWTMGTYSEYAPAMALIADNSLERMLVYAVTRIT
jgi:hypothetical protein